MRRTTAVSLLSLLSLAAPAGAATFVTPSVEEMARTSDAVVHGRVVDTASRTTPAGKIVTEVEVAVESAGEWKGATGASVRLVVPGGSANGLALRVDAAPTFAPGEEVVLFLARGGGTWFVNGLALGKFLVVAGEARPAVTGAHLLSKPLPAGEREVAPMGLGELEQRVRAAR
jgi:hypothetical protein